MSEGIAAIILQRAKEMIGIGYVAVRGEIAGVVAIEIVTLGADGAATIAAAWAVGHNAVTEGHGACVGNTAAGHAARIAAEGAVVQDHSAEFVKDTTAITAAG